MAGLTRLMFGLLVFLLLSNLPSNSSADSEHLCPMSNEINESRRLTKAKVDNDCRGRPWLVGDNCECGDSVDGNIYCDSTKEVFLMSEFCMAYDKHIGEEVVGRCPYTYSLFNDPNISNVGLYLKMPSTVDQLEHMLCDHLNRRGFFCGKCKANYSSPMYPDFMKCVECDPSHHVRNWILYFVISFGPLTVFLILVVCLRISATSASMNAFIFVSQIISHPPFQRGFNHTIDVSFLPSHAKTLLRFLHSLYGLWNLDFFTALIPPFCLPHQNSYDVISLTYTIALYPLLLLILVYLFIELHSRNFRIFVRLWKPFHLCYARFRRQWDIRASVIDAFATFLLLSCVKLLFLSSDFFAPSQISTKNGTTVSIASYFDASLMLSPASKPKLILSIIGIAFLLLVFVYLPAFLLLLYPCGFCQKCLSRTRLNSQALRILMDSFHGCYKNGTDGVRDCRSFAALFLFTRIVISLEYTLTNFEYHNAVLITCTVLAVLIAVVHPYNKQNAIFNHLDPLMILFLIMWLAIFHSAHQAAGKHVEFQHVNLSMCYFVLVLPILFIIAYRLRHIFKKKHFQCWLHKSHSDEDLLEQRSHSPYVSQSSTDTQYRSLYDKI